MAILKIARMGHPVLLRVAEPVPDPQAPEIRRLVRDMAETMLDASGLGLAAPQVHEALRIFVWRNGASVAALINPELELLGPPDQRGWEGCLSIPGLRGNVERAHRVAFRGTDIEGQTVEGEAEGLLARVMQHEFDHLNGILYPSRMTDMGLFGFTDELARAAQQAEAARSAEAEGSGSAQPDHHGERR
ncbi:peptide deformylase [Teichococcus oryzae]|uniref:Peptide deformylase n=1 Tax=Teichococcus oryzae TaxID=1608942 RepID=A0A5B2TB70_9PROT|nr:peptide deformylase [Pseudoroseomonas oryzae]KAA2211766.1 peptide deformylase [Pseudoroseomonas oryzae]